MIQIDCNHPTFFDVDDTLIIRDIHPSDPDGFYLQAERGALWVKRHWKHINLMRDLHAQGLTVVVWSAGGSTWASHVVRALGIEDAVDLVISKPVWIVDDKESSAWMPKANYINRDILIKEKT